MAAPQIASISSSITSVRWQHYNSYNKQLSHFKVYDRFHSTKPARACAQTMGTAICAYARSTRKCNYRFLDIQVISNKLGVTPVVHRDAPSYSAMHISQYLHPDRGN
ncbi:hypothetical protein AVEN_39372-1 [Araneus ventricosus]|uniref:Uncharacterized protein n=1 Tax=Araneus ventricosus TaxID=182803 RepID=A0A4Y2S2I2_ARAVE|nr:hypothetical protein AVEN_102842-1 [Araneus ventricosus]GBN82391.1 hypothetical protein AVEN_39372-1 [Araneus ventricosus]